MAIRFFQHTSLLVLYSGSILMMAILQASFVLERTPRVPSLVTWYASLNDYNQVVGYSETNLKKQDSPGFIHGEYVKSRQFDRVFIAILIDNFYSKKINTKGPKAEDFWAISQVLQ